MIDTITDLSKITTIPNKTLEKLFTKMIYCISDAVYESWEQGNDTLDLNIGIGTLSLKMTEDEVKYKFIPSEELSDAVKNTILNEQNLLEDKLEQSFVDKVTHLYKDLL